MVLWLGICIAVYIFNWHMAWWQSCGAFNCRILYGLYLPTVILTIIWYSITHSLFHSRLKNLPFLQILPTAALPFCLNIHYMDSPDCILLFLSISKSFRQQSSLLERTEWSGNVYNTKYAVQHKQSTYINQWRWEWDFQSWIMQEYQWEQETK